MNRLQLITIGAALVLFIVLYFGCDTTPKDIQALEKTRAFTTESTDLPVLLEAAQTKLDAASASQIATLQTQAENSESDSAKVETLKQLSSKWYQLGEAAIAGAYAQNIAELVNNESSWSTTGTTFLLCLQTQAEEQVRSFCMNRAVKAFENAVSINPDNPDLRTYLALCYTEMPPQNEPMKGILMLRELNQQYPDNVLILNSLARLAIRTNQLDRAKERLERSITIEPDNVNTICLLARVYEQLGESEKAKTFAARCETLNNQ